MAMYNRVVSVITKVPAERTESEILPLLPWFSKKSKLFENIKSEIMVDILRNCAFQVRNMDDVIIRQGDRGDCFYIILSGKVSVYINTDVVPDDPTDSKAVETDEPVKGKLERLDRTKFGNFIVVFSDGRSFGELALINKDNIRNASIIADERTDLVVIDRDLFNRCLRAAQEADLKARLDFVNSCALFNTWLPRYKRQAVMSLRKEELPFDSPIVRQGDALDGLYFITRGQARVVVDILMHVQQYPQLKLEEHVLTDSENQRAEAEAQQAVLRELQQHSNVSANSEDDSVVQNRKHALWDRPLRRQGYAAAEQRLAKRNIEISLVTDGEIIGTVEQALDLGTYAQSVICTQPTEVYILDAKNFERLILRRNPRTLEMIRRSVEVKLLSPFVSRSLYMTIPLIHTLVNLIEKGYPDRLKGRGGSKNVLNDSLLNNKGRNADFIPHRGPVIDYYGPGTVFFRNKQLREIKKKQDRHRLASGSETARSADKGAQKEQFNRSLTTNDIDDRYLLRKRASQSQFEDWETSGKHLVELEKKMLEWHSSVEVLEKVKNALPDIQRNKSLVAANQTPMSTARGSANTESLFASAPQTSRFDREKSLGVVPLRRLQLDSANLVKPGAKVILRRKSISGDDSEVDWDADDESLHSRRDRANCGLRNGVIVHLCTPRSIASQTNRSPIPTSSRGTRTPMTETRENSAKIDKLRTMEDYQELKLKLRQKEREFTIYRKVVY